MAGVGWRVRRARALLVGLRWLSACVLWPSRVPGLRKDRAASVSGFGLSGGFGSFRFRQQRYGGVLVVNMASSTPTAMPAFMI